MLGGCSIVVVVVHNQLLLLLYARFRHICLEAAAGRTTNKHVTHGRIIHREAAGRSGSDLCRCWFFSAPVVRRRQLKLAKLLPILQRDPYMLQLTGKLASSKYVFAAAISTVRTHENNIWWKSRVRQETLLACY
jgi:hypothetical protein